MEIYKNLSLEDLPNEEWRDVVGYEGLYQVSNMGRVKSLERQSSTFCQKGTMCTYSVNEKICKQHTVGGYLMVHLSNNNKKKLVRVHRLVAMSFMPNPNNYPQINHINENKTDNTLGNIEWCTCKQNNNHGTRNKRMSSTQRNDKKKSKRVLQYSLNGELVKEWESICDAGRAGYNRQGVSRVCRGMKNYNTSGGYIWKFK